MLTYSYEDLALGIDIGTTDIKCSVCKQDEVLFQKRIDSVKIFKDGECLYFSPQDLLKKVKQLLADAKSYCGSKKTTISIVSQAPSLCIWNQEGSAYGISYLSFYGDAKKNSQSDRLEKSRQRLNSIYSKLSNRTNYYISGITGYVIHCLTGKLTLDSITAWEIGIEAKNDINKLCLPSKFIFPQICSPLDVIAEKKELNQTYIAGATDSAVLPLATKTFSDLYVYLGTWGSLLQTQIQGIKDYYRGYWMGQLHKWLISIPDMVLKCDKDPSFLFAFFNEVAKKSPCGSKITITGGLSIKYRSLVTQYANELLAGRETIISSDINTSLAASRLAMIKNTEGKSNE